MISPLTEPGIYDVITLDGEVTPGLCVPVSGGDRELEIQSQQAPGYLGAFTVMRLIKISTVGYRFELWNTAHFAALWPFLAKLSAGIEKRPPRVYQLIDPSVAHNKIKLVAPSSIGAIRRIAPTKWGVTVNFWEFKKRRPIGGPLAPRAKTDVEKQIEKVNGQVNALQAQVDAHDKAKAKGGG